MKIHLFATSSTSTITVSVTGDVLTVNDEEFDFSFIPEGASLPASATGSEYFFGDITRDGGVLSLNMFLPYSGGGHFDCPEFLDVVEDGPVELPTHTVEVAPDAD